MLLPRATSPSASRSLRGLLLTRSKVRHAAAALALAVTFSVATYPAPTADVDTFRSALRQGADRLLALQRQDGTWPAQVSGPGDLATSGRPARAVLSAYAVLREPRYLRAAQLTADALAGVARSSRRVASNGNLLFLAEFGRETGRPEFVALARDLRTAQLHARNCGTAEASARELMTRENRTSWLDGAWRNYLLWHGGEMAELARAVGDEAWADTFAVAVASSWAPKHDHAWWAMGAGRMLEALAQVPGPEARRLAGAEFASLRNNEVLPGLPWNDTPYDTYVYPMESAAALQGLLAAGDAESRTAALAGLSELVRRQAPSGGWAATLSLLPSSAPHGTDDTVPSSDAAVDETPELDAELVLTLAAAVRLLEGIPESAGDVAALPTRPHQAGG